MKNKIKWRFQNCRRTKKGGCYCKMPSGKVRFVEVKNCKYSR